jgi:hypothetical protein
VGLLSCDIADAGELTIDSEGATSVVDQYTAIMESVRDTRRQLVDALPGLQRGAPHPTETGLYVSGPFEAKQVEHSPIWRLRVSYSDQVDADNPLARPAVITFRSLSLNSATLLDNKGRIMLNTAGFPVEPQERREAIWSITVQKNVADYPAWVLDYPESINNDAVRIRKLSCPPKTLSLAGLTIPDFATTEKGVKYLALELELLYRKSTWQSFVPSLGFHEKKVTVSRTGQATATFPRIQIDGDNVTEPMLLDRNGAAIRNAGPQDVVTLKFTVPEERAYGVLPLK